MAGRVLIVAGSDYGIRAEIKTVIALACVRAAIRQAPGPGDVIRHGLTVRPFGLWG